MLNVDVLLINKYENNLKTNNGKNYGDGIL